MLAYVMLTEAGIIYAYTAIPQARTIRVDNVNKWDAACMTENVTSVNQEDQQV